jgi:ferredoxin
MKNIKDGSEMLIEVGDDDYLIDAAETQGVTIHSGCRGEQAGRQPGSPCRQAGPC